MIKEEHEENRIMMHRRRKGRKMKMGNINKIRRQETNKVEQDKNITEIRRRKSMNKKLFCAFLQKRIILHLSDT
jgi:hypothetical protein